VISAALKKPLKTRLGNCIYIISLPNRPDDYIGFTSSCPPTFYNKIAPMDCVINFEQQAAQVCNFDCKHRRYIASLQYKIRENRLG